MTITWAAIIVMLAIGFIAQRRKKERFAFIEALLLLALMVVISTIFVITVVVLVYLFSSWIPKLAIGSLFVLYGLVIILAGVTLFGVLKLIIHFRRLSMTALTLIEYYIQWSLIYATIYQIVFDNLLKSLQLIKDVSSWVAVGQNLLLVAVLSSFIASWIGVILFKFDQEKI